MTNLKLICCIIIGALFGTGLTFGFEKDDSGNRQFFGFILCILALIISMFLFDI